MPGLLRIAVVVDDTPQLVQHIAEKMAQSLCQKSRHVNVWFIEDFPVDLLEIRLVGGFKSSQEKNEIFRQFIGLLQDELMNISGTHKHHTQCNCSGSKHLPPIRPCPQKLSQRMTTHPS